MTDDVNVTYLSLQHNPHHQDPASAQICEQCEQGGSDHALESQKNKSFHDIKRVLKKAEENVISTH